VALLIYLLVVLNRIQKKQRNKEALTAAIAPPVTARGGYMDNKEPFTAVPAPETTQGGYMENSPPYSTPISSAYPVKRAHMGNGAVEIGEQEPPAQLE
jgi:hypothetical protein